MPKSTNDTPETQVKPDPILEKRTRRTYSTEYKMNIIAQADACQHGELAALLRRERLYRKQVSNWRREFAEAGIAGLEKTVPGPSALKTPEQHRIEQLEKANLHLFK